MKLSEVVQITPSEREKLDLPGFVSRILPKAQAVAAVHTLPVEVDTQQDWKRKEGSNKRYLSKTFKIENDQARAMFMLEIINYEMLSQHHAKITMLKDNIRIDVWTHSLNDITEADLEYIEEIDAIYNDLLFQF